jgi:hypothetical protein
MIEHDPRDKADRTRAPGHASDVAERSRSINQDETGDQPGGGNPSVETDQLHALTSDEPPDFTSSLRHLTVDADNLGDIMPGANDEDQ